MTHKRDSFKCIKNDNENNLFDNIKLFVIYTFFINITVSRNPSKRIVITTVLLVPLYNQYIYKKSTPTL